MAEIQNDDLLLINRSGTTYTATAGKWPEEALAEVDPMKGHPMWVAQK